MTETSPCYGATIQEWGTFDILMGLTADLLPVVSNPKATISPDSKMKDKGKVPSIYNRHGHVVGIQDWTRKSTDEVDIERWSKRRDYGICIQTRNVRALDVDVPDATKAAMIAMVVEQELGFTPPVRYRDNSWKFLMAFRIAGDMPKRVIKVQEKVVKDGATVQPAWLIEFLANGQQFVAAGTHSTGARIEWKWGDHEDFPEVTLEQFEKLWKRLCKMFAIEAPVEGGIRKRGAHMDIDDAVAQELHEKNLVLGEGNDGQLFIECPWMDGHSMDSGVTQTAYFPRGTGGYELGHFKCLHAGCATHSDTDFEEKLGLRDDMFGVVTDVETDETGRELAPLPKFQRNKQGFIEACLYNLRLALERSDLCGCEIRFDTFRTEDMIRYPAGEWRGMTDGDSINLREHLEKKFKFKNIGREMMRDAIVAHGERHQFDTATEWLECLAPWDGVPRVGRFLAEYFGAEDDDYATAVSTYLWTALAGRCMVPGIKADMALVLQGEQGVIKSTAISAIAPWEDAFAELSLGDDEDKLVRLMRGKLVVELGELRGFYMREFEAIKAFLVKRRDQWVPKYRERAISAARRCIFIGTTNHTEFLVDETGNRRFLPIHVERADIKRIRKDRLQLWAEARDLFMAGGIAWADAERLGKGEHDKFVVHDSWEDDITKWLHTEDMTGEKPVEKFYLKTNEVLRDALNIDARSSSAAHEKRVAKVLKSLGYVMKRERVEGKRQRVYVKMQ